MKLLITFATYVLGFFALMLLLSLIMIPVVALFIFKTRKNFFDDFNVRNRKGKL